MRKIVTVRFEFDPGDRVVYTGPMLPRPQGPGIIVGEHDGDYVVQWPGSEGWDEVAREDLRPYGPDGV